MKDAIEEKKCYRFGCNEMAVALYADRFSTCYGDPVCEVHQFRSAVPDIITSVLGGQDDFVWCPQGAHVVMKEDFEPRAGMCGACISEAMAEAPEYFSNRGLVASQEEQEAYD